MKMNCRPDLQGKEKKMTAIVKERMTLEELKTKVRKVEGGRVPGRKQVRENSLEVASIENGGMKLTVFDNGYVLGEVDGNWTVFPVCECEGYLYGTYDDENDVIYGTFLESEYFKNISWFVRVMMEAYDRIEKNTKDEFYDWLNRNPNFLEDLKWMVGEEPSAEDVAIDRIEKRECLETLTRREQWAVELWMDNHGISEIAEIMKTTVPIVKKRLLKACEKLSVAC